MEISISTDLLWIVIVFGVTNAMAFFISTMIYWLVFDDEASNFILYASFLMNVIPVLYTLDKLGILVWRLV